MSNQFSKHIHWSLEPGSWFAFIIQYYYMAIYVCIWYTEYQCYVQSTTTQAKQDANDQKLIKLGDMKEGLKSGFDIIHYSVLVPTAMLRHVCAGFLQIPPSHSLYQVKVQNPILQEHY